jgi:IMP dehydrogenase
MKQGLTFNDVLLVPQYSEFLPKDVSVKTTLAGLVLPIPVLSSAMDTVTEAPLAIALANAGGLGILHKNLSIEEQAKHVQTVKQTTHTGADPALDSKNRLLVGAAVGVSDDSLQRVAALVDAGVDIITIDSAHGHSKGVIDTVKAVRNAYPNLPIIGGNVVTKEAAKALIEAGASAIKVGVGPGSICTTRIVAGVGVPQVTAVMDVAEVTKAHQVDLIADGGIQTSGDLVKALAAGASVVMLGGLLAATEEAPGELVIKDGKRYKTYEGMGSLSAMKRGSKDRYFQTHTEAKKLVAEGVEGLVLEKGPLADVVYQLIGGLRQGMGYCGAKNVPMLQANASFVQVTAAGVAESNPHHIELNSTKN